MRKTGAEIISTLLERQGVHTISGIPGGASLPLYDALRSSRIRHVLARHEQGAGFIAQGLARVTGRAGVCLATSGPGATNLLTAIADAKLDSIPLVAITGQVPTGLIGTDAFQEVDTYGLTIPITKHNYLIRDAGELLQTLPEAFEIAESGRPGPVVVDVPKDVQTQHLDFDAWPPPWQPSPPPACAPELVARLADLIRHSQRPVLYVGGGIIASGASDLLREFARANSIPVATTLAGLGAFPAGHPLHLGMLGMHGARYTNMALEEADLLLAFGVRFDDRATGKASEFCRRATIAHVDIDPSEIDKIKAANVGIVGDVGEVLRVLISRTPAVPRPSWQERIADLKRSHPGPVANGGDPLRPLNLIRHLADNLPEDAIVTTDVGQHQMWVAQAYPFRRPRTLLTSGGLGTMGFGLPAAIGAALARPGTRVVCVSGDGSILMNVQELATLADLGLDVTIVLMNNGHLGLVRQQQQLFYGRRYHASRFETQTDFVAMARSFGVRAYDLGDGGDPVGQLREALSVGGPAFVHAPIHEAENVLPMVPPGGANRDMIHEENAHAF
jgi:acetolactate synthase-1/2/3 large subunit